MKNRRTFKKTLLQARIRKKLLPRLLFHYVDCCTLSQIHHPCPQRQHLSIPRMTKELRESEEEKVQTSWELKEELFPHLEPPLICYLAVKERSSILRAM